MKSIAPNTLIQNRYLIVHLIGKGGMGEVYLSVDQRLGSAVALKRTFFSDDALLGNAFEREARTLARLRHPVLPKVSDHFTDEGTQYLVMEHISGEDISKRLESMQKPFPLSWVLFWADQLLDALTYLHTHEPPIIHRDIKPQNLKLTDENHIVLLDFGLSKNSAGETRATTTGSIIGYTPHYAPMEQIRGTGTDARSDIYSLAATLYQILTAQVPPDALTRADSLINGMPDPITPINELNPEVSRGISDVIIKGMAISQEQRYKTAREMQKALRDAYARMQNETTANTVEYSSGSEPAILQAQQKSVEQKTEFMPVVPIASQTAAPINSNPPVAAEVPDVSSGNGKSSADFDATMRYDEAVEESAPKQADIKTEVFLAGNSSAIADALAEVKPNDYGREKSSVGEKAVAVEKVENFEESKFFTEDELNQSVGYSPEATTPLMKFDGGANHAEARFDSFSEREDRAAAGASVAAPVSDGSVKPGAPVKQKSNKSLAVAGGLAALLFLVVGAAAVGWFMLRDSDSTTENTAPTPTAESTIAPTPTAEPTLEAVTGANANSDGNTNELTNGGVSSNANDSINGTRPTNTPVSSQTVAPGNRALPTPTATRNASTPRPAPSIRIEPTPRVTPKVVPSIAP